MEFLSAVLDGLAPECGFEEDIHDLLDVVVDDQVRIEKVVDGATASTAIIDLLIEVSMRFFWE